MPSGGSTATGRRVLLILGLVIVLIGVARAALPYSIRVGPYVYQTLNCSSPVVRLTRPRLVASGTALNPLGVTQGACWSSAVSRVEQGGIVLGLAVIGTAIGVWILGLLSRR